ncbi:hypothetical protein tpqmel_0376 [Candidatus Gastranaerophilus sp. (ex Termes propinquus)]|nr:hypothetical protein tpqmel_0376 [Candidatus Gastranaerophilus sp. (ex Termes propinquus)]
MTDQGVDKSDTRSNKVKTRSVVLRAISNLKSAAHLELSDVEKVIWEFSTLDNQEFLAEIILKEIDGSSFEFEFDKVLSKILFAVVGEASEGYIWKFLSNESTSDVKKLFLMNVLREMGTKVDALDMARFLENSTNLLDFETQKFLEMAKMNPEVQIDFFDFFFTVNDEDKTLLLRSIIEDFGGDELASILSTIIYCDLYSTHSRTCIEALKKTKSYLAFSVLEWVIGTSCDETLVGLANKILNELKISGLREKFSSTDVYKKLLQGSHPHGFWVCTVDGNSNFSAIFSRERKNGTMQTFFTVVNLKTGPSACFGFNEVAGDELEIILSRFFKNSESAQIPIEEGVKILNTHIEKAFLKGNPVPYELLCWRQIILDIVPDGRSVSEILSSGLECVPLSEYELKRVVRGNIVDNWFFKYGENSKYDELLDDILQTNVPCINKVESLLDERFRDIFAESDIDERLLYHSYFCAKSGLVNIANILYSLIPKGKIKNEFLKIILKKSVYEYFLGLRESRKPDDGSGHGKVATFFEKKEDKKRKNIDYQAYLELIEKAWMR